MEEYEEEAVLLSGCKEYFWLLCKLIDNIHVKDASQTTLLDLDALARHLADCIRRYFSALQLFFAFSCVVSLVSLPLVPFPPAAVSSWISRTGLRRMTV